MQQQLQLIADIIVCLNGANFLDSEPYPESLALVLWIIEAILTGVPVELNKADPNQVEILKQVAQWLPKGHPAWGFVKAVNVAVEEEANVSQSMSDDLQEMIDEGDFEGDDSIAL